MPHKISILVRADVGRDAIELFVTGCLTQETSGILASQIAKTRGLDPSAPILVDFAGAQHIDLASLDLLRSVVEAQTVVDDHRASAVQFVLPDAMPSCPQEDVALADQL